MASKAQEAAAKRDAERNAAINKLLEKLGENTSKWDGPPTADHADLASHFIEEMFMAIPSGKRPDNFGTLNEVGLFIQQVKRHLAAAK